MKKTFYIENLGCAKNQVDAEVVAFDLINKGYECTNDTENAVKKADIIIVNTCAFIESAKKESIDVFFELNAQKKKSAKIVITGCLGQRYKDELVKEMPEAFMISGVPQTPSTTRGDRLFSKKGTAYVKILEGCNHRCSFCAIPIIRGPLVSISEEEIIKETSRLVKSGVKEINLIGQDLASYGIDKYKKSTLTDLLAKLSQIEGDFNIRCLYIHPDFFPSDLISVIQRSNGKILPYFDIPLQHASKDILKAMHRAHTKEYYLDLIKKIRSSFDECYIRTTYLLGFKNESKETLEELKEFIEESSLDAASFFEYSREEGTEGERIMSEDEVKSIRPLVKRYKKKLEALQDKISSSRLGRFVGTEQNVLIEEKIEGTAMYFAHIPLQCPDTDGTVVLSVPENSAEPLIEGEKYRAKITKVNNLDLEAEKI